jgi:WD40 repeat protein
MPEALRKRLGLPSDDILPAPEFELTSAPDAMSAFEQICLSIPASGALIAIRDTTGLRCVGSLGDAAEVGSRLPPDFGMALECLETGSVVFSDLGDQAQRIMSVGMSMEGVSQIRSAAALPMRANNVVVGLIAVFSHRESAIQPRDIKALAHIVDFWGPLMADEWFPDGIPASIAGDAPATTVASAAVTEFPLPVEDAVAATETPDVAAITTTESKTANNDSEAIEENSDAKSAAISSAENEGVPVASSTISAATADSEAPLAAESTPIEEPPSPEIPKPPIDQTPRLSDAALSFEALTIARAAKEPMSPVFLAPAELIPPEAFHSGEPLRLTWFVVFAVFLIVLLPFWYLRAHWKHTNAANKVPAYASSAQPANSSASGVVSSPASAAPIKKSGATDNSSPIAKTVLAPDEEMPKPLPDLNTPPPSNNPPPAATLPKPTLPAIISRILKSPNTAARSDASAPSAPDISANSESSAASEATSANESASTANSEASPGPAQPILSDDKQSPNFTLTQTLKAHSGWVSSLAFSPAGQLASGSWDRTVKFWDLSSGHEVRALNDKIKQIQAVAFSPDGKILAVEDTTDTVAIFDAATGARLRELPTDKSVPSVGISWVYSISFSPDGRWLASAVDDKTVRIWDVATGAKIRDLNGPRRPIVYAAFSPNGELVATGNDEKSIQLWNVASGAPTSTLTGHKKVINAVAFSPDGKTLASASGDKTIRLWDAATGKHIRTFSGHQAAVSSISFSHDGHWLASGSWDKTVRIWNVATGKEVQTLRPDARAIYSVTFDPRGHWLAAGSEDGGVEIWQWNGAAANSPAASTTPEAKQ